MKLTVKAAAQKASVSKSLIYALVRQNRLKHYRIGVRGKGKILIDESDLEEMIAACQVKPPEQAANDDEQLTFLN